ncbi:MAG: hypothetical protein ACO3JL_08580, partial [Myxococcota bacterium]
YAFAIWPDDRRQVPLEGTLSAGARTAPLAAGYGAVRMSSQNGEAVVVVEGMTQRKSNRNIDEHPVRLEVSVPLRGQRAVRAATLRFRPWTRELLERTAADLGGPPLYPLRGTISGALPDELITLSEKGPMLAHLSPNAAVMRAPDGRRLQMERSGLVLELPLVSSPTAPMEAVLFSTVERTLHLELLVNGRVVALFGGALQRGRNLVSLPEDMPQEEGWVALRVFASPLDRETSVEAVAWRWPEVETPAALLEKLSSIAPLRDLEDPLYRHFLHHPPQSGEPRRARRARVEASPSLIANVAPPVRVQRDKARAARAAQTQRYRTPFRLVGVFFALCAGMVALRGLRASSPLEEGPRAVSAERAPLFWAALAAAASLGVIGVLDWVVGFCLGGG